jgi:hypothetical protein
MTAATAERTCALAGCDASLEHMRPDAQHCTDSHRAMAHQGKSLRLPGGAVGVTRPS